MFYKIKLTAVMFNRCIMASFQGVELSEYDRSLVPYEIEDLPEHPKLIFPLDNDLIFIKDAAFQQLEDGLKSLVINELDKIKAKVLGNYSNSDVQKSIKFLKDFILLEFVHYLNLKCEQKELIDSSKCANPVIIGDGPSPYREQLLSSPIIDNADGTVEGHHYSYWKIPHKLEKTMVKKFSGVLQALDAAYNGSKNSNKKLRKQYLTAYTNAANKVLELFINDEAVDPLTKLALGKAVHQACDILKAKAR